MKALTCAYVTSEFTPALCYHEVMCSLYKLCWPSAARIHNLLINILALLLRIKCNILFQYIINQQI